MKADRGPEGASFSAHRLFPVLLFAFAVAAWATLQAPTSHTTGRRAEARSGYVDPMSRLASGLNALLPDRSLVPVEIEDVVEHQPGNLEAVLLVDEHGRYVLPVFVDPTQGEAVRRAMTGGLFAGTVPHDLMDEMVRSLGATVDRVLVRADDGMVLRAEVILRMGGEFGSERIVLDALPGDALALALTSRSPVFATGRLLEEQGIPRDHPITRASSDIPSPLKEPESL